MLEVESIAWPRSQKKIPTPPTSNISIESHDTTTAEVYTLSLHDALPIWWRWLWQSILRAASRAFWTAGRSRSEEHTSELQSQSNLVCRLLLEKKNTKHRALWRLASEPAPISYKSRVRLAVSETQCVPNAL